MKFELNTEDTWSFRGGRRILDEKGLLNELAEIAAAYDEHGGGNQNMAGRAERLDPLGWDQSASATFSVSNASDGPSRRASFNAYKDGVLVEHERGEQMRANWHLMKMEAAYRDPDAFNRYPEVEAGTLVIPSHVSFPTLNRTKDDVRAVLANYFDFSLPLFVWQYSTGNQ
jgi:hypothetical protein